MLFDLQWDFIALQEACHVKKSSACLANFGIGNVCVTRVGAIIGRLCIVLFVNSKFSKSVMDYGACDGCVAAVVKIGNEIICVASMHAAHSWVKQYKKIGTDRYDEATLKLRGWCDEVEHLLFRLAGDQKITFMFSVDANAEVAKTVGTHDDDGYIGLNTPGYDKINHAIFGLIAQLFSRFKVRFTNTFSTKHFSLRGVRLSNSL